MASFMKTTPPLRSVAVWGALVAATAAMAWTARSRRTKPAAAAAAATATAVAAPAQVASAKPKVIFVLGGPGVGKGTQCANIVATYNWVHLSAGDLLRAEQARPDSKNGAEIKQCIKEGKIVPVVVTVALLKQAMAAHAANGNTLFLIDGFPRNAENRMGWESAVGDSVDLVRVLFLNASEEVCEARCLSRGEQARAKAAAEGKEAKVREDDNIEAIRKRFATNANECRPIVEHYRKLNLVTEIDCAPEPDKVWVKVREVVEPLTRTAAPQPPQKMI